MKWFAKSYQLISVLIALLLFSTTAKAQIGLTGSTCIIPDGTTQYIYALTGAWVTSDELGWRINGGVIAGTSITTESGIIQQIGIQIILTFTSGNASIQVTDSRLGSYTLNVSQVGTLTQDVIGSDQTVNYQQTPANLISFTNGSSMCTVPDSYDWQQSNSYYGPFSSTGISTPTYAFAGPLTQTTYFRRAVSISTSTIYSNVVKITVVSSSWENLNYIRVHEIMIPGVTNVVNIDALSTGGQVQTTSYLDGLGRPIQKVSKQTATPQGGGPWGDLVAPLAYDNLGRQPTQYLPYTIANFAHTSTGQAGAFETTAFTDQPQYYMSKLSETSPFNQVAYDQSPLSRTVNVKLSGTNYAASNGTQYTYDLNDADNDNVRIWSIGYGSADYPVNIGVYQSNSLFKTTETDVNGKTVIEYTNNLGQLVLRKVQLASVPNDEYDGWICTYNVYDDFGRIRFTIQPEAVNYLYNSNWTFDGPTGQTVLSEQCFQYLYDEKGRVISKKTPGSLPLSMIYDKRDRLVFSQDGNQRDKSPGEWLVNFYDGLDRTVLTALFETSETQTQLQTDVDNELSLTNLTIPDAIYDDLALDGRDPSVPIYIARNSIEFDGEFESVDGDEFETRIDPNATTGTLDIVFAYGLPISESNIENSSVFTPLKYFYYDDYTQFDADGFNDGFQNAEAYSGQQGNINPDPITASMRTHGKLTGTRVRVLNTSTFLQSTFYYDEKERQIQVSEQNIKSGTDVLTQQYNFENTILSTYIDHNAVGTSYTDYGILTKFDLDNIFRVKTIEKEFGSSDFQQIVGYDYDDLGRLLTKHLAPGFTGSGKDELEALAYSYNIHNQLTGINKDYALKTPGLYDKWSNFFGMYLGYDKTDGVFATPQLDGHIMGQLWSTQGDDAQRKFDYTYDNAGRLATANFNQIVNPSDSWNNAAVDFSVSGSGPSNSLNYDLDGNLQSMVQKGIVPGHTSPMTVDSLAYTYAAYSSKLTGVADNGNLGSLDGQLGDFHDATNGDAGTSGAYLYDDNGNLTTDLYKNINQLTGSGDTRGISYNYLDKPDQVRIVGKGTIQFIYDADGNKLQKVFTPESGSSLPAMTLTYIGEFIYAASSSPGNTNLGPDNLRYILFEEGRLRTIQSTSGATLTITGNIDMPDGTQGVFDYFVKDHLGNTRMVLTEETHVATSECTMELAYDYSESRQFGQIDANGNPTANNEVEQRFAVKNIPGQGTNGGGWTNPHIQDFVSQVGNLASSQMGPNTLLKVMAGDQISANVIFYYQSTASRQNNSSLLTAMIISLAAALSGSPSTTAITHENVSGITDNLTGTSDLINLTNPGSGPATATTPQAYLSVLFFDEQMNFISDGSIQSQVYPTGSYGGNIATFQKAPKNGYAFVFVSNQSDEMVYFDNLIVQQHYGNIIEEDHYYPFGLKIAGISSQKLGNSNEGTLDNKYRFQGDFSEEEDYTSWNEFDLRMYNPQIGRWNQQDPFDQFATPYVAMGNDPINYADPGGGISFDFGELGGITGSVFGDRALISFGGALVGYGIDKFAGGKGWIGAITGGLTGLGATFIPAFDVDIDLNEVFSPSWASALLWQVHQKANENALLAETPPNESNSIDARRRAMNQGTVWADSKKNQTSPNSYMHAMSDGRHRQPVEEADLEANNHVRKYWALARAAQAKGNEFEAYRNLGIAIHPLQDATSPAHHGFQPWDEDESFEEKVRHTLKENKYPGPTSNLQKVTNTYVDLFMNSRLPLPEGDLFKSIEADKQSNPDDVIEGFIRFMRIRFFDYSPLGGDHSLQ